MRLYKILHLLLIFVCVFQNAKGQTIVGSSGTPESILTASTVTLCVETEYTLTLSASNLINHTNGIDIISTIPLGTSFSGNQSNSAITKVTFKIKPGITTLQTINALDGSGPTTVGVFNFTPAALPIALAILTNNSGSTGIYCDDPLSTTADFSVSCNSTNTAANQACFAPITYAWSFPSQASGTNDTYSVPTTALASAPANNITTVVVKNGTADVMGSYCQATATVEFEVRSKPNIGGLTLDLLPSPESMCVYGQKTLSTSIDNSYSGGETFSWEFKQNLAPSYNPLITAGSGLGEAIIQDPAAILVGTVFTKSITIEPEIAPYNRATNTSPRIPLGEIDIRVTVGNTYGCSQTKEFKKALMINDRPAVMIYNMSTVGGAKSNDGEVFCTGKTLTLRQHHCNGDQYTYADVEIMNYSEDPITRNPNIKKNSNNIDYTPPCNASFYNKITWSAIAGDASDVTSTTMNAAGLGVGNYEVTAFPTPDLSREVIVTTNQSGGSGGTNSMVYGLEVEDMNGCINSDKIRIEIEDPEVVFEYQTPLVPAPLISGVPTINICENTPAQIKAGCLSCGASPTYSWTKISGPGNIVSGGTSGTVIVNGAGGVGSSTIYEVTISGTCTTVARITVIIDGGPNIQSLTPQTVCVGQELIFENSDPNTINYTGIKGFINGPTPTPIPGVQLVSSTNTIKAPPTAVAGSHTYLFVANFAGCTDTAIVSFTVNPVPYFDSLTHFGLGPWSSYESRCNDKALKFVAKAKGGTGSLVYNWTATGQTSLGPSSPVNPMGTKSTGGGGGGYWTYTWFWIWPMLEWVPYPASENSYTFDNGHPTQKWVSGGGVELGLVVSDSKGCIAENTWKFDIIECGIPEMVKTKGVTINSSQDTFKYFGCLNQWATVKVVIPSVSYTPSYEWRQLHKTNVLSISPSYSYQMQNSDPDTIFTICIIYKPTDENKPNGEKVIVKALFDTTIVSRGFPDIYPHTQAAAPDTAICLNDVVQAHVSCSPCRGRIEYIWGTDVTGFKPFNGNGNIWDSYLFSSVGVLAGGTFPINLKLKHGEGCEDNFTRQVYVNELPSVSLSYKGGLVNSNNPIYLCNGKVDTIYIDTLLCPSCAAGSYVWNTGANTLAINVSNQGGYYAEVMDGNFCKGVTNYAIVIDANEGLNSVAIANPTQLCGGGNATLEVAPCAGCTYTWNNVNPIPTGTEIATTRTHGISTTGNYYAKVTNQHGCTYPTSQVAVSAVTLTIPSIAGTTDSLCFGEKTTLSTTSVVNASYQWYKGSTILSGATNRTYTTGIAGIYKVAVTYPNGCIKESPLFNVYSISFKPTITAATEVVCSGETADLSTNFYPGWQYQWYDNGNLIVGAVGSIYSATTSGSHYVKVTTNYGCIMRSDSINITTSSLPKPTTSTVTPSVCPGEYGKISVSLCTGCSYQWFDANTGLAITIDTITNYRYDFVTVNAGIPNEFYCIVSGGGCSENSDTVSIVYNSIFTPAINSSSNVVCNGQNPLLITPSCVGCSYSWLLDGVPVLGALNDTFYHIINPKDTGLYQIAVTYSNGCSDTSTVLKINDGSYDITLAVQGTPGNVICNGVGKDLEATSTGVGASFYTLFLNNTPVTGYTNITSKHFYNTNIPGVYTVQSIDSRGCREMSSFIELTSETVQPILSARATSQASSVNASAICTSTGTVFLEVTNCVGCTFDWTLNGLPLGDTTSILTSQPGASGAGTYIVNATKNGCPALSNPKFIADLISTTPSANAKTTRNSLCDGESVVLEHIVSNNNPTLNCPGCSFRWLRGSLVSTNSGNPINGANSYQYIANTEGNYYLEMTTTQGCVDTSQVIPISKVDPPTGFMLDFHFIDSIEGKGTPLASNGSSIDMNYWVYPNTVRNGSFVLPDTSTSYFTSQPLSGALLANAGLSGTDRITFTPHDSLSGSHLITYHYITKGCEFTAQDVIVVLPPAGTVVTNSTSGSVPYEACVGDQLTITTTNLDFPVYEVRALNDDTGLYTNILLSSRIISSDTFGVSVRWNSTLVFNVPAFANSCNLLLVDSVGADSITTSFVLIHNTDLSFTGLPNMLCSNGTPITLSGNPMGGVFRVKDAATNNTHGGVVTGGNVLNSTLIPPSFYNNGSHLVNVLYEYRATYTNGNPCPNFDTISQQIEVKDVRLTSVTYNTISVSQSQELLTNLVKNVVPYRARANKPNYTVSFAGSFTFPAGNPTDFLPKNAGVGTHPLTYKIKSGDCVNSVTSNITVKAAPTPISIPDTICRNHGVVNYSRGLSGSIYNYLISNTVVNGTVTYFDRLHTMKVYSENSNQGITWNNTNAGSENFDYNPSLVTGNYDTLVIEYWFSRGEDSASVAFDSLEYVVGRVYKPIYIEDLDSVAIDTSIVNSFYCQANTLHLLAGKPASNAFGGGRFMLYGGNGQYAMPTGDTLKNSVINPYQVNSSSSPNGVYTYDLVYILNGAVCKNSDTMQITISKLLEPSFATVNGKDEFCDTDPDVAIIHNVMAPDTAIWKIGGVPQAGYVFPPNPLDPGTHVVELQMKDIFGCTASVKDTFFINPLPELDTTPALALHYCANDPVLNFVVSPSPSCPSYMSPGHVQLNERFLSSIPPNWLSFSSLPSPPAVAWVVSNVLPEGGTGAVAFVERSEVPTDAWLMSPSVNMVVGHHYRLTYMVRAGELDPTCAGLCDASLQVMIGTAPNAASMNAQLDYQPVINNDKTYIRYVVEHYHDPLLGFTTGTYHLGFHATTVAKGRSLRLDNIRMRDLSIENCNVNGIGYVNGSGIHNVKDSLYQFNPLAVTSGNIEVKYIYTTVKGCQDSLVIPITVDSFPIVNFTNMDSTYCLNEPTIMLTGSPLGGRFTKTLYSLINGDSNLVHVPFTAPLDTAWYPVNYQTNVPGVDVVSYTFTDRNGCSSTAKDTVVIRPMLDSAAVDNALDPFGIGHCYNAVPSVLNFTAITGAPLPGKFYGVGVRNGLAGPGAATFHPDSAALDMGHTGDAIITYIYPTTTDCMDTTRFKTRVHAMPNLTFANLPDSICLNADTFQLLAINNIVKGPLGDSTIQDTLIQRGTYVFTDIFGNTVPNFIGLFDSIRPPAAAGLSQVNVQYTHTSNADLGSCTSTIYDSIRIDTVPVVYFQGMKPFYCENEPPSILMAFPPYKVGSGYMMLDSVVIDSSFYWINPLTMVGAGSTTHVYPSYYTYTDTRGCRGEVFDTFEVRPIPKIVFSTTFQDTFCREPGSYHNLMDGIVSPKGGFFTDNLALTSISNDSLLNLSSIAGPRLATYHFKDSMTACYNNDSIWLYLFNGPQLAFDALGGCSNMDITFDGYASNLVSGIDSITRIWWVFDSIGAPGLIVNSPLDTSAVTLPDILHLYASTGTYKASLFVENQGNCVATISKDIIISPTVTMLPAPYFQDFNAAGVAGAGEWYADKPISATASNIWSHQPTLTGTKINSPNGAWVTAADTLYGKGQKGWVYSPCFDFTTAQRPMIAFDLWRDMLSGIDGLVMEYYDGASNSWQRLGDKDFGVNWYQSNFVLARPGNQQSITYPRGWTGRANGFESVRFRLDQFKGQNHVRLRLAFGSSPQTVISDYEGAAFDNVWVGERTRNVLVEHFDNFSYTTQGSATSDVVDRSVYDKVFNSAYGLDVFLIQYQTNISSQNDFIYLRNNIDLPARVYQYGIADDNRLKVDGRTAGTGVSLELNTYDLDYDMLQFPDFDISIATPSIINNVLTVSSTVTPTKNMPLADYAIHAVVIQDSATINARQFEMLSVARKMLPNAGGESISPSVYQNQQWLQGVPVNGTQSWDFTSEIGLSSFNPNQLEVIVFIQDMDSEEVFQAQTTQNLNKYTGTGQLEDAVEAEILDLKVYPNPSSDYFNVEFDKELEGTYNWRLVDVAGRILQNGTAEQGTRSFTINAEKLTNGAYFFVINNDKMYAQRKLIVIK